MEEVVWGHRLWRRRPLGGEMTAVWTPEPRHAAHSQLARFHHLMRASHGAGPVGDDYSHLHTWSVRERATFWRELWRA